MRRCGPTAGCWNCSESSIRSCWRRWPAPWTSTLAIAVAKGGGLGSLPAALLDAERVARAGGDVPRRRGDAPLNLNFFCPHAAGAEQCARACLARGAQALLRRVRHRSERAGAGEQPCAVRRGILRRRRGASSRRSSASTSACRRRRSHAREGGGLQGDRRRRRRWPRRVWLDERGCDAIIAQGYEAGGHRGMFLTDDLAAQVGTFALVPQVADAVQGAGHRRRRHRRRPRHRRGAGARRRRRADRHAPICTARNRRSGRRTGPR